MIELRISGSVVKELRNMLGPEEACAVLFAEPAVSPSGRMLLIARRCLPAQPGDYVHRHELGAELNPVMIARVAKEARTAKQALVFLHTHPGEAPPHFSTTDDAGEKPLAAFLRMRGQNESHLAIVLSSGGLRARVLGSDEEVSVVSVGERRRVEFAPIQQAAVNDQRHDRQVRAFGDLGQKALRDLSVAIVGLGGTGSIAAQQLAHLGVRRFLLIDPDVLDETNLNRVVGSTQGDVGRRKADVAADGIRAIDASCEVKVSFGNVVHEKVARLLVDADIILGCTDSHGSRSVMQQVAFQYFIPCIDIGSTIVAANGELKSVYGRIQLLGPDHACLWCSSLLDAEQVRQDLMSDVERRADPYISGVRVPAPAVISLNGSVVSLAVTMLLGMVTEAPIGGRYLLYNALTPSLRTVRAKAQPNCFICSQRGALGRGDSLGLYARQGEADDDR